MTAKKKVCVVCRKKLVVETRGEYQGDPMQRIYGPGGASQLTTVTKTYCGTCGLVYVNGGGVAP